MIDLPSTKHHAYHGCAYCRSHVMGSWVPSVDTHSFIARYNLIALLALLDIKSVKYGWSAVGEGTTWRV